MHPSAKRERGYTGRPIIAYHFQCGGRRGGLPLGIPSGGGMGGTGGGQEQQRQRRRDTDGGEDNPGLRQKEEMGGIGTSTDDVESGIILCRRWGGRFHGPGMAPVGVQFSDGAV